VAVAIVSGCQLTSHGDNLVNGKKLFIGEARCGSCHTLARAGTKGTPGPDLDQAFQRALVDGFKRSTIKGVVHGQILHPEQVRAGRPGDRQARHRHARRSRDRPGRLRRRRLRGRGGGQAGQGHRPVGHRWRRRPAGTAQEQNGTLSIPPTQRPAVLQVQGRDGVPRPGHVGVQERLVGRPRHLDRGQRRQREGQHGSQTAAPRP
jgi:hypothetical protein